MEVAGLGAELAKLGEHLRHQRLERVACLLAFAAHLTVLLPRVVEHVADRANAARGQALVDLGLHRLALALDPAAVLGQVGQARGQLAAELAELVEQVMTVLQDTPGTLGQRFGGVGERRRRALAVHPRQELGELAREIAVGALVRRQRLLQRLAEGAGDALPGMRRDRGCGSGLCNDCVDGGRRGVDDLVGGIERRPGATSAQAGHAPCRRPPRRSRRYRFPSC